MQPDPFKFAAARARRFVVVMRSATASPNQGLGNEAFFSRDRIEM
jgi:hypothetical protein